MRIPTEEQPVLENLIAIRHRLSALKKDRDSYAKPDVVLSLWSDTEKEIERLCEIRSENIWNSDSRNRLNDVLDDVMSLLSLFFMSIGKTREIPAVYAQLVTVKQYLDQLVEMGVYTEALLIPTEGRLKDIESIINLNSGKPGTTAAVTSLVRRKLTKCKASLQKLLASLHEVSPDLKPIQNELVELRRQLSVLAGRACGFSDVDIQEIQKRLRSIDNTRIDGKFLAPDGSIPAGQALVVGLLEQLFEEAHDLMASTDSVSESLVPIADRLKEIKSQLERLSLTHQWTLRETDLYTFQQQLQEIEKLRVGGKFLDAEGNVPEGQTLLNFLLRACYRLMSKMLSESVPVAEALMPIYNQLSTVRRCLLEVNKWGAPDSVRELYPYQMKLASIDNMRVNGTFYDEDGMIPEGQGLCVAMLNECYDILHDLVSKVEEDEASVGSDQDHQ
ncbi:hypothetical protein BGW37DRAFT_496268 [Umbelopsis sp. PMI_123]|nr:hypothetical protein BGW37DRAFT_496268 [Umbelopsis sp. PMI_123]